MSKAVSKPGDMYNYRAAAYLKTSAALNAIDLKMKELDFSVVPRSLPKENSFLGVEPTFDIFVSGSERELLCECKHHDIPHALSLRSIDVEDSVLEFIAAEKYRINSIKRDGIFYAFVTNCPTADLNKEITCMKSANDHDVLEYSKKLEDRAPKKWPSFDREIKIRIEWIRNVLLRLNILEIEEGRLQEASNSPIYDQEFRKIIDQVSRTNPRLIPLEYRIQNTVRFDTTTDSENTIDIQKRGYLIEISQTIISQILSYSWNLGQIFAKPGPRDLEFIRDCKISHHNSISTEKSMELIVEAINDLIRERSSNCEFFVAINPGTYDVYIANVEWFYKIASNRVNSKGFYELAEIAKMLPLETSRFVLISLVQEVMRIRADRIVRQDVMDLDGVDTQD